MRNILLTVSYDGTRFCGWQKQTGLSPCADIPPVRTVQAEIEKVLELIHKQPTALHGSGRTDSGVHAVGQAANFFSPLDSIPAENYIPALNSRLPRDIRIVAAREVPMDFHARFSAAGRTYRYFMNCRRTPFAHEIAYCWPLYRYPDVAKLNRMVSCLSGEIDFTAFCAAGDKSLSKCRFIESAAFFMDGETLVFEISANAFLWKMVRSITGSVIYFEKRQYPDDYIAEIISRKKRSLAGPTAPPDGLFLWHVDFCGVRRDAADAVRIRNKR
ncbi:MAG: tRNA pseudouridine(38-40) synthase TruA [Bacteroides sp.]|nr:tRNA pseudouridine(38-40) synthase TruA [Prevotella sp.]MCM1407342.1 tRNA pseudouridine(38-40) synthase TruA [Treponema brennaborense]MCM1469832.1 tRNA pseudouridine(38-40) synthase TruA [Bacteroides sp.]